MKKEYHLINCSEIDYKILIKTDNYTSYNMQILEIDYQTYETSELQNFFPSSLYQYLFYHPNTSISTQILCDSEISINHLVNITIT